MGGEEKCMVYVLVFVADGLTDEVFASRSADEVESKRREILKHSGAYMEKWGYTDPVKYEKEYLEELTEIDGKHYHVYMHDCLNVYEFMV